MKAQIITLRCDTTVVVVTGDNPSDSYISTSQNGIITINGANSDSIAKGIARMINENQCIECGKFNGLHGDIFHATDSDNGEVRGYYEKCSKDSGDNR